MNTGSVIRCFFAIPLNDLSRCFLKNEMQSLRPKLQNARFIKPENFHITLRFIAELPSSQIGDVVEHVGHCLQDFSAFCLNMDGVQAFPKRAHPRLLCATIYRSKVLTELHKQIDNCLLNFDLPPSERAFRPHVTLARFKKLTRVNVHYTFRPAHRFLINEIQLVQSTLTNEGSIYTPLAHIPLKKMLSA